MSKFGHAPNHRTAQGGTGEVSKAQHLPSLTCVRVLLISHTKHFVLNRSHKIRRTHLGQQIRHKHPVKREITELTALNLVS